MQRQFDMPKRRILVVDDEPALVDVITTCLDLAGYQSFFARDGADCMNCIGDIRPAAMILDLVMPRLDGFGVLRQMARSPSIANTPVMVLSACNRMDDVRVAINLGARDFLTKPFSHRQLLSRVAKLIRKPAPVARGKVLHAD